MHLCIPDYEKKEGNGWSLPSLCSYYALSIFLNEKSETWCSYHFPVHDINDEPANVVIIRNLPSGFYLGWPGWGDGDQLKSMIENVSTIVSIDEVYGVVRVTMNTADDASKVVNKLNGYEFKGTHLIFSQGHLEQSK